MPNLRITIGSGNLLKVILLNHFQKRVWPPRSYQLIWPTKITERPRTKQLQLLLEWKWLQVQPSFLLSSFLLHNPSSSSLFFALSPFSFLESAFSPLAFTLLSAPSLSGLQRRKSYSTSYVVAARLLSANCRTNVLSPVIVRWKNCTERPARRPIGNPIGCAIDVQLHAQLDVELDV